MSNIRESTREQLHRLSTMIISEMTTKEWAHRNAVEYYEQREEEQDEEIARLSARLKVLQDAFQRDIDGSWFSDKFSFDVDQALTGDEVES